VRLVHVRADPVLRVAHLGFGRVVASEKTGTEYVSKSGI
jgi:hypothetical protein